MGRVDPHAGVPTPARGDDVGATVPVEVSRRHAVPATHGLPEAPLGTRIPQPPFVVQKQLERPPIGREDEIGPAIPVDVGEDGGRDQPDTAEQGRVGLVQDEAPALVAEQAGRLRRRIGARCNPPADEEIERAVPVHVGDRERADARDIPRDDRRHLAGAGSDRHHGRHRRGLRGSLRFVARLPHEQRRAARPVGQREHGGLVVARGASVEIDLREAAAIVAIVGQRAAPAGGDQQVLIAVAIHVVPRDPRTELAQGLGKQRLPGPVVERRFEVAMTELRGHVAEPGDGGGGGGR